MDLIKIHGLSFNIDYNTQKAYLSDAESGEIYEHIKIPSEVKGCKVVAIMKSVFINNPDIKSIYIPSSVKYIGAKAFMNCTNLKMVYIDSDDDSCELNLYHSAFMNCKKLEEINLRYPTILKDWCVFEGCCQLKSINSLSLRGSIPNRTFSGCNMLENFSTAEIDRIEENAFLGVSLKQFLELGDMEKFSDDFLEAIKTARISCGRDSIFTNLAYCGYNVSCP